MENRYSALLFYGYEDTEEGVFHSFDMTDEYDEVEAESMVEGLAELLDCEPGDERFNWNAMSVALPKSLVSRIQRDAIMDYKEKEKLYGADWFK